MTLPMKKFVDLRLAHMRARPLMWAATKESFGAQLLLLAEISLLRPEEDAGSWPTADLMHRLFGPGNIVPADPLDETWAVERVDITMKFIEEQQQ